MNITGTGYNQYKKINTQNKGKVNNSQQQSKDPGFKSDVFKSLEYVNRDLVKPKNKQNAAFKGLVSSKDITGEYIFLNNDKVVNNVNGNNVKMTGNSKAKKVIAKNKVELSDRARATEIEAIDIKLFGSAFAGQIKATNDIELIDDAQANGIKADHDVILSNKVFTGKIEAGHDVLISDDTYAGDIKAQKAVLMENATVDSINADQLVKLSGNVRIRSDITMTGTDNPIVKIIGSNVEVGDMEAENIKAGDINFPENSNGQVILVSDDDGHVANIDKNNVKNGVINVEGRFINLTGSMEVNNVEARQAYLLNNVKAKKVEGENITLEEHAHADEIISKSYVDLQQDATAGKITAKKVYLEGSPSVNEVNAEQLVELHNKAKVNGDIKLTGNQEPKVLLSPHASVGGKIIFPENSNGKVFLTPFKRALNTFYNEIDESNVENGILIKSKDPYPRY